MTHLRKHKFQAITKSPKAQRFQEELLDEIRFGKTSSQILKRIGHLNVTLINSAKIIKKKPLFQTTSRRYKNDALPLLNFLFHVD